MLQALQLLSVSFAKMIIVPSRQIFEMLCRTKIQTGQVLRPTYSEVFAEPSRMRDLCKTPPFALIGSFSTPQRLAKDPKG